MQFYQGQPQWPLYQGRPNGHFIKGAEGHFIRPAPMAISSPGLPLANLLRPRWEAPGPASGHFIKGRPNSSFTKQEAANDQMLKFEQRMTNSISCHTKNLSAPGQATFRAPAVLAILRKGKSSQLATAKRFVKYHAHTKNLFSAGPSHF